MKFQRMVSRIAVVTFVYIVTSLSYVYGQRPPRVIGMEGILMTAPREVETLLEEARENLEREQWSEATLSLGLVLGLEDQSAEDFGGFDYFLPDANGSPYDIDGSVFRRAYEMLETLPAEGTKVVELRYGVNAKQGLDLAISKSDWDGVRNIAGKYGFTNAGQDAFLILAERALGQGEPRLAAMMFGRLVAQRSAFQRFGPQLGVAAAAAFESSGMTREALECLDQARENFASAKVDWNGQQLKWDASSTSEAILKSMQLGKSILTERVVKHPNYFGGNPKRNGGSGAGSPLPILRWHVELHESLQHKETLDRTLKQQIDDGKDGKTTLIPSRYPISVDSWIISPTYDQRLVAIDLQTGLLAWPCVYTGMPLGFSLDRFAGRDGYSMHLPAPDYLVKRVWGETSMGQPSSDGKRIFSISELPSIDVSESFALGPNARFARPTGIRPFNVLQCWSIPEQGKLLWEVGGQSGESEKALAGVLFLGSPLPIENELLTLGELNGEVFLISLAPDTGKLNWRQPIAANQSAIAMDAMRRQVGATPAVDGSIVVCPTLSGFLVAFDIVTKSLLWVHKYPVTANQYSAAMVQFGSLEAGESSPFATRSAETSVVLQDGVVLFAPPDGQGVYSLSLTDGKLLWKMGTDSGSQLRYIAAAWNGMAILAYQKSIIAYDLKTGANRWLRINYPNDGQLVGRGVRNNGNYYVPTSTQEIHQIDLNTGKITDSVRVERPLGNLICAGDRLISASPFELNCYTIRDAFQSQVTEELKQNIVTPRGLAQQGELALAAGNIDQAIDFVERANSMDPNNPEISLLLRKVGVAALDKDFDKYVDRVSNYNAMALGVDKAPYLRMLVRGLQRQGRYEEMLQKLFELSDTRTSRRMDQMSGDVWVDQNPQWSVQEDRWIATQIARVIENLPAERKAEISKQVQARVEPLRKQSLASRRLKLEHLQAFEETEPLRIKTALDYGPKDSLQVERLLLGDNRMESLARDSEASKERRRVLASIYAQTRRSDVAFSLLDNDPTLYRQIIQSIRKNTTFPQIYIDENPPVVPGTTPHAWPKGEVIVDTVATPELGAQRQRLSMDSSTLTRWQEITGDSLRNWEVYYGQRNLRFYNPKSDEQFQLFIDASSQDIAAIPKVYAIDSIAVIELNKQLIVIDTLRAATSDQDGQLWRQPFGEDVDDSERARVRANSLERNSWGLLTSKSNFRVVAATRSGVIVLDDDAVICLDLLTGSHMWTARGFRDASFARNDGYLAVLRPDRSQIVHMDLRDGAILKTLPFDQAGFQTIASVGKAWLQSNEKSGKRILRLVDGATGNLVHQREHKNDTKLAIAPNTGIVALKSTGELWYWNLQTGQEHESKIEIDEKAIEISVQQFGDKLLVLPYASFMELNVLTVKPSRTDPNFAPCAGSMFAISAIDGKPLWKSPKVVHEFYFPLNQSQNSPAAFLVRMITLNKVRSQTIDQMSIALVDVETGDLLFERNDFPAERGVPFRQEVVESQNLIRANYLGNLLEFRWTENPRAPKSADAENSIGALNPDEYRKQVEENNKKQLEENELNLENRNNIRRPGLGNVPK